MKNICILGATGSIGTQALEVIASCEELKLHSFSYHRNDALADDIVQRYGPCRAVRTSDPSCNTSEMLLSLVEDPEVDIVLHAVTGTLGIKAAISALRAGKTLALANKETLVAAGDLVMRENTDKLIPVDSEHSAIYQCLGCSLSNPDLDGIVLTASGGPFRHLSEEVIASKRAEDALKHPNWNMGRKISIDSATMMNKGLEIIEAMHLFGLSPDLIEVVVHPESIIHSMVRFRDGSLIAELSRPSMKQPIALALTGQKRMPISRLRFSELRALTFEEPDPVRFPCLALAVEAARAGGIIPAVMNAANEVAVEAYLAHRIGFYDISRIVERTMDCTTNQSLSCLEQLEEQIARAKECAALSMRAFIQ